MAENIQLGVVDLGSNSFHLIVAELYHGQLYKREHLREQVQIANGLTAQNALETEAQERALACLERFGQYTRPLSHPQIAIAGTYTLRKACQHLQPFLRAAEAALGHSVRILSGEEEAKLIYKGVFHSRGLTDTQSLVLDIGGGSTELIIGKGEEPLLLHSLELGCVRLAQQFFSTGPALWVNAHFQHAYLAACDSLAPYRKLYWQQGWQECWGTSGSLDAITRVLMAHHWITEPSIDVKNLERLRRYLAKHDDLQLADLPGLNPERASIFACGLAILCALFDVFEIQNVRYANGGLREGLLYQLAEQHGAGSVLALDFI